MKIIETNEYQIKKGKEVKALFALNKKYGAEAIVGEFVDFLDKDTLNKCVSAMFKKYKMDSNLIN